SRTQLKEFCRANGFTPIVIVVAPPFWEDRRLAERFRRCLDANRDGKLTKDVLRKAPDVLRKYDSNDDEYLDRAELLAGAEEVRLPTETRVKLDASTDRPERVLRIEPGGKVRAILEGEKAKSVKLLQVHAPGRFYRLFGPGNWVLSFRAVLRTPDVRSAGAFLI